jgi:hypothetical protein
MEEFLLTRRLAGARVKESLTSRDRTDRPRTGRLLVWDSSRTWPRELASAIVFTSPLMHYGDSYRQYAGNPAEDVLRALPTVWDETRVLDGAGIG